MIKSKKNFELDEMGQANSEISQTDQVISPDNTIGVQTPKFNVGIPFKAGEGINLGDYQTRVNGSYTPGKQWLTKS